MLTVITPCTRPYNLPLIMDNLSKLNVQVEWIIIYDKNVISEVDTRIALYSNPNIKLVLLCEYNDNTYGKAGYLRNIGMEMATGDYILFLDDDTVVSNSFYQGIKPYLGNYDLIVYNQARAGKPIFTGNTYNISDLDTGQVIVKNGLNARWNKIEKLREERAYFNDVFKEVSKEKIIYIPVVLSYYNFLRHG